MLMISNVQAHLDLDESGGTTPTNRPDARLLRAIIDISDGHRVTKDNLIQIKASREARAHATSAFNYGGISLSFFSRGEPILLLSAMGENDDSISVDRLKTWLGEERLPDGYAPRHTVGMISVIAQERKLIQAVDALHASAASQRRDA
jgi:hypothetical protein